VTVRAIRCGTLFDGTGGAPVRLAVLTVQVGSLEEVGT
jgi:hypothetical protein